MPPKSTASKSRRKECAKKRKHDVGSSSRAVEGESDLLIPGGRRLRHLSGAQIARVEEQRAKGASGGYYFDLPMLDAYGCREEGNILDSTPPRTLELKSGETFPPILTPTRQQRHIGIRLLMVKEEGSLGLSQTPQSLEMNEPIQMACMVQQLFTSQTQPKCPYVWIGPVVTRLCHGLGLQAELAREKSIASMRPFTDSHLSRSYAPRIGATPRPQQDEPPHEQEPASMRAFQLQLHNQSMNAFNQRMDLLHEELMRQNEAIVRQEERQDQQFQAIEQLRLWMEQRFPPPSQGGDASY
nr:hypothetical protein Iba_chr08bCG9510 [Ipomoea batatas]